MNRNTLTTQRDIRSWLFTDTARNELATIARGLMSGDRLVNILYVCVQKTPALAECTPASLMNATKTLINMGCEPDNIHGFLVPRKCKTANGSWVATCVPIPSARGLLRMARNNGITNLNVNAVYEEDSFQWFIREGRFTMSHDQTWSPAPDSIIGFYCTWTDKDGYLHGERMSVQEINTIRDRSDAYRRCMEKGGTCPWITDYEQMALKTVIKRAAKQWDLPLDVQNAMLDADIAEFGTEKEHMRNVTRQHRQLEEEPQPSAQADQQEEQPETLTPEPPPTKGWQNFMERNAATLFPIPAETSAPRMEADQ